MSDGTRIGTPVELRGTALNQVALQVPRAGWRVEPGVIFGISLV